MSSFFIVKLVKLMPKFRDFSHKPVKFTIEEASGTANGSPVIAKVSGEFFVPDGISRNRRDYTGVWQHALQEESTKEKLNNYHLMGSIGHDIEIGEKALREGMITHYMSNLEIREDKDGNPIGYGEALLLDTQAGRNLKTYLESGMKLYSSSRADGQYEGIGREGTQQILPESFELEGFDFVLNPGFLKAQPKLLESFYERELDAEEMKELCSLFEDVDNTNSKKSKINKKIEENTGGNTMPEDKSVIQEMLTKVSKENGNLEKSLNEALVENKTLRSQNEKYEDTIQSLNKALQLKEEDYSHLENQVHGYTEIGTIEKIKGQLQGFIELIDLLVKEEIIDSREEDIAVVVEHVKMAGKALRLAEQYVKLGSIGSLKGMKMNAKRVNEALNEALFDEKSNKNVSIESIKEAGKALRKSVEYINKNKVAERNRVMESLSNEIGVPVEQISKVYPSVCKTTAEVRSYFDSIRESLGVDKYKVSKAKSTGEKFQESNQMKTIYSNASENKGVKSLYEKYSK